MPVWFRVLVCLLSVYCAHSAKAASVLNYQGKIYSEGKPFSGSGYFSFALLDSRGMILWSSGEFPYLGSTNIPKSALRLNVREGMYSVRLGDTALSMPPIDRAAMQRADGPKLRVWFNDGKRGWAQLTEEPALAAANTSVASSPPDVEALVKEVRELRALVQRQAPAPHQHPHPPAEPQRITVPLGDGPMIGSPSAPLVLVEFTDFQCGFCKRFHDTTMPELIKQYVDTGKLRIRYRNLPLDFHTNAGPAALAALCAGEQGKFKPMRDKLFVNTAALSYANFEKAAEELKLDVAAWKRCYEAKTFDAQIKQDMQDAAAAGITGTPSFVLGRPTDKMVSGVKIVGAQPFANFDAEIKKLLATPN